MTASKNFELHNY